jgi:hypothetical protein
MPDDKLSNLLNIKGNRELADLVQRAQKMGELARRLSLALPAELADSVIAANIRDNGELVVICSSSARAARLRFESGKLAEAASATGVSVKSVVVRVSTEQR